VRRFGSTETFNGECGGAKRRGCRALQFSSLAISNLIGRKFSVARPLQAATPALKYSVTGHALLGAPNPVAQLAGPGFAQIFTGHHMYGYDVTADLDVVTVRVSVLELDYRTYSGGALNQDGKYHFYSAGVAYDRNNVIAQGEFIELRTGDPTDAVNDWYLMGGYRLNKWVPYLIYANSHQNQAAGGTVPEMNGPTESAGVRLDLFRSVDFKAQFDHAKAYDYGTPFINDQPGFKSQANIFSLAADFVF